MLWKVLFYEEVGTNPWVSEMFPQSSLISTIWEAKDNYISWFHGRNWKKGTETFCIRVSDIMENCKELGKEK